MLATINRGHEIWHLPKIHALLFSGKSNNTLYTINLHEVWFPKKQWLPFNDPWSTVQQTNATFFCLHLFQRRASVSFLRVHWTGAPLARIQKESNSKPQTQSTSVFRYDWMSTDEGDTCIFIQIYMYCINPAEAYKSQQSFNWGNGIQTDQTQRPTTPNIHMIFSANIARHRKIQQVFIKCSCLYWYCGKNFKAHQSQQTKTLRQCRWWLNIKKNQNHWPWSPVGSTGSVPAPILEVYLATFLDLDTLGGWKKIKVFSKWWFNDDLPW